RSGAFWSRPASITARADSRLKTLKPPSAQPSRRARARCSFGFTSIATLPRAGRAASGRRLRRRRGPPSGGAGALASHAIAARVGTPPANDMRRPRSEVAPHARPVSGVRLAELARQVALLGQHRGAVDDHQRKRSQETDPGIVRRAADADLQQAHADV